jgi:hypothetical protein
VSLDGLIREMARTWKEGGGDAMGFHWCHDRIRHEIVLLEQTPLENYIGSLGVNIVRCSKCKAEQNDLDGFGVLYCEHCKYCAHASSTDGKCDLCGVPQPPAPHSPLWHLSEDNRAACKICNPDQP